MKSLALMLFLTCGAAWADPAVVTHVKPELSNGTWRFDVEILHPDSGWDHYSDGWKILAPDGKLLGERPLAHPHENEQPFTRSISGISIPANINHVFIQANCNLDGETSKPIRVDLN